MAVSVAPKSSGKPFSLLLLQSSKLNKMHGTEAFDFTIRQMTFLY